jgi:flagellar biosynthesis GTPase FlhF
VVEKIEEEETGGDHYDRPLSDTVNMAVSIRTRGVKTILTLIFTGIRSITALFIRYSTGTDTLILIIIPTIGTRCGTAYKFTSTHGTRHNFTTTTRHISYYIMLTTEQALAKCFVILDKLTKVDEPDVFKKYNQISLQNALSFKRKQEEAAAAKAAAEAEAAAAADAERKRQQDEEERKIQEAAAAAEEEERKIQEAAAAAEAVAEAAAAEKGKRWQNAICISDSDSVNSASSDPDVDEKRAPSTKRRRVSGMLSPKRRLVWKVDISDGKMTCNLCNTTQNQQQQCIACTYYLASSETESESE